ncbi:DNA invertase Pin-like site-specific DNA recombinase [Variovorax boronicumulans]|uniref:DNA invertase Pin-like site-specific DNA recombinase n=1 Tax=Variovorax boronicumulans TaxID=436515 RepID=A0AAW8DV26_9BURK|nr:recombinase family protein [Variovorax boronicumulans]MDP9877817.1 DNA invertase Pin-like site-specific DNA recombinase [Variovorax boronicumulans]MDP9923101.1 DNA invertase Pin-like site-specific DNA recombinase [Variovorax boronicumulans]
MTPPKKTTTGQRIGYVRVSSADQNDARQLEGVELEKIFTDKASGKDTNRPQLQAMLGHVRDGDHLYVHSMDRLSRSLVDLQHVVESLTRKGVTVQFMKEKLTFQKPSSEDKSHEAMYSMLMLQLLGAVGQFERALIKERQREGIAIAKTKGVYKGRKPSLDAQAIVTLKEMATSGVAKVDIAQALGISRASVYEYLKA